MTETHPTTQTKQSYRDLTNSFFSPEQRNQNATFYDQVASDYVLERSWIRETELSIRNNILSHLGGYIKPVDKVLIAGVGTGKDESELQQKFNCECFGLDLSREMLIQAKDRIKDKLTEGNATRLPYKTGGFDFVYCEAAGEHMDVNDVNQFLTESKRVLKREESPQILFGVRKGSGKIVEVVDEIGGESRVKFFSTFTQDQMGEIFKSHGLRVVESWSVIGGTPVVAKELPWLFYLVKIE
jgi:ubiquinone/menaquinone biosynthesis C-methylase UbiE